MSVAIAVDRLRNEIQRFTFPPYLITVSDDAHPHAVAVDVTWERDTSRRRWASEAPATRARIPT